MIFLSRLLTTDETWLYHYDPETKQEPMGWRHSGSLVQKIPSSKIRWKISRLDFFWDEDGILLIDYLPEGQTINAEYYSFLLVQFKDILKEICHAKFTTVDLFLHDNVPAHRALSIQNKLAYRASVFLITHSILRIWPSRTTTRSLEWKKQLKARLFSSDAEVIVASETWLDGQYSEFFESLGKVRPTC